MTTAREFQRIPVIANTAAPEVDTDVVGQIIKLLDRALVVHEQIVQLGGIVTGYHQIKVEGWLVTLFEEHHPDAAYAYRLWASAHGFDVVEHMHEAPECRMRFPVVEIVIGKSSTNGRIVLATLHGKSQWRDQHVAEVTASAVTSALREPHWTSDHTTALDARDNASRHDHEGHRTVKKIEIKHRWTGAVLYATEVDDNDEYPIRTALNGASLDGASLDGARLDGARLDGANLVGANLVGASLVGASLVGARLDGASLDGARLDGANLVGANLVGASLVGARLDGASLDGARLDGARLDGARLDGVRDDIRSILDAAPNEVAGLLAALTAGTIDGSCYTGQCACLVGTIAKVRGVELTPSGHGLADIAPNSRRPAECWFMALRPGHTPENHPVAAITADWIVEWLAERGQGPWIVDENNAASEVQP